MATYEANLPAINCQGCFQSLAKVGSIQKGVLNVAGEYPATRVVVEYDEAETDINSIKAWLSDAGYAPND